MGSPSAVRMGSRPIMYRLTPVGDVGSSSGSRRASSESRLALRTSTASSSSVLGSRIHSRTESAPRASWAVRHTSSSVFLRSIARTSAPPRSRSFSSNSPERSTRCSSWRFSTSVSSRRLTIRPKSTIMPKKPARVPLPSSSSQDSTRIAPAAAAAGTRFSRDSVEIVSSVSGSGRGPLQADRARPRVPKRATPGAARTAGAPRPIWRAASPPAFKHSTSTPPRNSASDPRGSSRTAGRVAMATA